MVEWLQHYRIQHKGKIWGPNSEEEVKGLYFANCASKRYRQRPNAKLVTHGEKPSAKATRNIKAGDQILINCSSAYTRRLNALTNKAIHEKLNIFHTLFICKTCGLAVPKRNAKQHKMIHYNKRESTL